MPDPLEAARALRAAASPGPWKSAYGRDLTNSEGATVGCFEISPRPVDLQFTTVAVNTWLELVEALDASDDYIDAVAVGFALDPDALTRYTSLRKRNRAALDHVAREVGAP